MNKLVSLCVCALLMNCQGEVQGPALVPSEPAASPNYWCTWYAQNYWQQRGGEIKNFNLINNPNAREEINYKNVFDADEGWATTYLPNGRVKPENEWFYPLADVSTDIKSSVKMDGNVLVIPGRVIEEVGTAAATDGDSSVPGLVLKVE